MNYQLFENVIYERNAEAFSKIEFKLSLYSARYDNINESFTRTNPDIKFNKKEQNAVLSIFECFRNDYIINICKNNNSLNEGVIDKVASSAKTASAFITAVGANVKNLSKEAIADIKSIWKWFKDIAAAGIKSVKDMIMKFMELLSKTGDTMCDAIINLIGNLDDPLDNPVGKNYFDKIDKLAIFAKPKEGAGFLNTINYIISKRQDVFRKLKLNESADSLYDNYYNNLNEGILSSTADNKAARWFFGIKNPEGKVDWKRSILASLAASVKYPNVAKQEKKKGDIKPPISQKKHGVFFTEKHYLDDVMGECEIEHINEYSYRRHPLAYLMEAAETICYLLMDLEDAISKGWLTYYDVTTVLKRIKKGAS